MLRRSKATSRETFLCLGTYAEAHVGLVYPWPGSYPLAIQFLTLHIGCATIGEGEEGLSAFCMTSQGSPRERPAWVEVDLTAIRHNISCIRCHVGPGCSVMAVVKANAYGHGLLRVAEAALEAGADCLGVALLSEAIALRQAGCSAPIVVLGMALECEAEDFVAYEVCASLDSEAVASAFSTVAQRMGKVARVHVKVDTGMGRAGVPASEVVPLLRRLATLPHLAVEGVFTHFATADEADLRFARAQAVLFQHVLESLRGEGIWPRFRHAANSAAIVRLPEAHHNLVRPGLMLYGLSPFPQRNGCPPIRPALSLKARLVSVKKLPQGTGVGYGHAYVMERPGRIAIVPLGYGDGFSWHNSNCGAVLLHGARAPIRGRICMDSFMVEVTDIPQAQVGDEVVILGKQGTEEITAEEIAARTRTIPYETVSALTERLPRHYVG